MIRWLIVFLALTHSGLANTQPTAQSPTFHISLSPDRINLAPGQAGRTTLSILPSVDNPFIGTLTIQLLDLPPNLLQSAAPSSVFISQASTTTSVDLVLTAATNAPEITATVTLRVSSGAAYRAIPLVIGVSPAAAAAPPPSDLQHAWDQIQHWGSSICRAVQGFELEAIRWLCTVYRMTQRAVDMVDTIQSDFQMLKNDGLKTAISVGVNALGAEMGLGETNRLVDQFEQEFTDWRRNYHRMVARVQAWMDRQRQIQIERLRDNPYPDGSPAWWAINAIKLNPDLLVAEAARLHRVSDRTTLAATAKATSAAAVAQHEKAVTEAAAQALQTGAQVAAPAGTPGITSDVERIREQAQQAVSTREVLQVLVESQARIMQQNLVNSQSIITAIQQTAGQQVLTTQQLTHLLTLEIENQIAEANRSRQALFDEVTAAYDEAKIHTHNLTMLAKLAEQMAQIE
jgi:hypothetical protein